jgi:hypothetical protein
VHLDSQSVLPVFIVIIEQQQPDRIQIQAPKEKINKNMLHFKTQL